MYFLVATFLSCSVFLTCKTKSIEKENPKADTEHFHKEEVVNKPKVKPSKRRNEPIIDWEKELVLTTQQSVQFFEIRDRYKVLNKKMKERHFAGQRTQKLRIKSKELRENMNAEIEKILNQKQYERYIEISVIKPTAPKKI